MGDALPRKNILIVDDDEFTRNILRTGLQSEFRLFDAAGWDDAQLLLSNGTGFELILIDQVLQKTYRKDRLDGIDICRKILQKKPDANVIIYTLKPNRASYRKAMEAGARKYIVKRKDEIQKLVRQLSTDLPYFFALRDVLTRRRTAEVLDILPEYFANPGCGLSIIDRSYGLWWRNEEHIRMMKDLCGWDRLSGGYCWAEYLDKHGQVEPCYTCPARVVFETGRSARTPVPMRVSLRNIVKFFDIISNPVKNADGEVIGSIQTVFDVTDRENLIALRGQLETKEMLNERVDLILSTIKELGYDRVRYYLLSADRSEGGREQVLQKEIGHKEGDRPKKKLRLPIKGDKYWEHTFAHYMDGGGFIYGDNTKNLIALNFGPDIHERELHKKGVIDWLELPLVADDEILGTICIDNKYKTKGAFFSKSDVLKLADLVASAGLSINSARKYSAMTLRAKVLDELRKIDSFVVGEVPLGTILEDHILKACINLIGAESGYIRLQKGNYLEIICEKGKVGALLPRVRVDLAERFRTSRVFGLRQSEIVYNALDDEEFARFIRDAEIRNEKLAREYRRIRTFGIFPISYALAKEDRVAGVMVLHSRDHDFFSREIVDLIEIFCDKAAAVVLAHERKGIMRRIQQADKMVSLGMLIAGLAHQIKNPVASLDRRISQLSEDMGALKQFVDIESCGERFPRLLGDVDLEISDALREVGRLRKAVGSLYLFVHPGREAFRSEDIHEVIDSSLELLETELKYKSGVEIVKRYDRSLPKVECSRQKLQQVFLNILMNALDVVKDQGVIFISTAENGSNVIIKFGNTGPEVPEEIKDRIFEPFFTTKEVGEGSGLGLAIVSDFVRHHNGSVGVDREGEQTVFTITLPFKSNRE